MHFLRAQADHGTIPTLSTFRLPLSSAQISVSEWELGRFTRLTNAFSKKVENHAAAVALYFMHYNFCRVHQTLRVTPAMEAKITDHIWTIEEMLEAIGMP